jgi:uncharacterized protein YkwD
MPYRRSRRVLSALPIVFIALLVAAAPASAKRTGKATKKASAASACTSVYQLPGGDNADRLEQSVLCLVNAERARRGLARLRANPRLGRAATAHSRDMVGRDYFDHVSLGGSTVTDRIRRSGYLSGARSYALGENLAWGTGRLATPHQIVRSWMNSPGHRRNILTPRFREIGIGVVLGAPGQSGRSGATYTTKFGQRA